MKTLYGAAPLHQRLAFLQLPPAEQLRQKFHNLRKLGCCPVCAREASPGPYCQRHTEIAGLLEAERQERLVREKRCELCEVSFHRLPRRLQAGARCMSCAVRLPEEFYGLPVCLPVYQQMVQQQEAGF